MSQSFKMKVTDIFCISNKVVFTGDLESDADQIYASECMVLIDGVETSRVKIEGEVLGTGHRDLWTLSAVNLGRDTVISHDVWLMSV